MWVSQGLLITVVHPREDFVCWSCIIGNWTFVSPSGHRGLSTEASVQKWTSLPNMAGPNSWSMFQMQNQKWGFEGMGIKVIFRWIILFGVQAVTDERLMGQLPRGWMNVLLLIHSDVSVLYLPILTICSCPPKMFFLFHGQTCCLWLSECCMCEVPVENA